MCGERKSQRRSVVFVKFGNYSKRKDIFQKLRNFFVKQELRYAELVVCYSDEAASLMVKKSRI